MNIAISEELKRQLVERVGRELNENPEDLVRKIKKLQVIAARAVRLAKENENIPLSEFEKLLEISRVTLWRKVNNPEQLQPDECIKILRALKII